MYNSLGLMSCHLCNCSYLDIKSKYDEERSLRAAAEQPSDTSNRRVKQEAGVIQDLKTELSTLEAIY